MKLLILALLAGSFACETPEKKRAPRPHVTVPESEIVVITLAE